MISDSNEEMGFLRVGDGLRSEVRPAELAVLSNDLKRMLRVQLKEFVHTIEDVEFEQGRILFPDIVHPAPSQPLKVFRVA